MKRILLLILICIPFLLNAQNQPMGNLTIFSEDGDKFFLILNGEKQNDVAQSNIRIEDLTQPYYNARIIFKDSTIGTISKNNLYIANPDGGVFMDVTYKIRKDKTGKAKLNYYSMAAVQQNYIPPAGMYVYHFGHPEGAQTTTTTTTIGNTVGANVNMNGLNMNVTITDPTNSMQTTTTTSTTTTTGMGTTTTNTNNNWENNKRENDRTCSGWPMKQSDFSAAKKTVSDASFDETKLSTAKSIASSNCLSSDQVVEICNLFGFEETKLAFAKFAYKHTTDPKNYFKVVNVFSFDGSKDELNKFISGE